MEFDYETLVSEVVLARGDGFALLVEGSSDEDFYGKFLKNGSRVVVFSCGSKRAVLDVMNTLEEESDERTFAIVDADFDRLTDSLPKSENVFVTDEHDLEMMMIRSRALDSVIRKLGSSQKIAQLGVDVRDFVLERAVVVGKLRFISTSNKLNLEFEGMKFWKFIDRDSLAFSREKFVDLVIARTKNQTISVEDVDIRMRMRSLTRVDPYQLCCGHDVLEILALGLRRAIGSKKVKETTVELLANYLHFAFTLEDFRKTDLYEQVRLWSNKNEQEVFE